MTQQGGVDEILLRDAAFPRDFDAEVRLTCHVPRRPDQIDVIAGVGRKCEAAQGRMIVIWRAIRSRITSKCGGCSRRCDVDEIVGVRVLVTGGVEQLITNERAAKVEAELLAVQAWLLRLKCPAGDYVPVLYQPGGRAPAGVGAARRHRPEQVGG